MPRLRWLAAALAVVLASFAFAACGGGDDDDDDGENDNTPAAQETTDDGDGDDGDGDDNGDGGASDDEVREALQSFTDASFTIAYSLTSTDPSTGLGDATMIMFKDGTDRLRFDVTGEAEGETFEFISISAGDVSAFCLTNAGDLGEVLGVEGEDGVCFENDPTGGAGLEDITGQLEDLENQEFDVGEKTEREIAGRDATCYELTDDTGSTNTVCLDDDGLLLAVGDNAGTSLEATDVRGEPSDGDFELPFPVQELPGVPEGQ